MSEEYMRDKYIELHNRYHTLLAERDKFEALYKEAVAKYTELTQRHAELLNVCNKHWALTPVVKPYLHGDEDN